MEPCRTAVNKGGHIEGEDERSTGVKEAPAMEGETYPKRGSGEEKVTAKRGQ